MARNQRATCPMRITGVLPNGSEVCTLPGAYGPPLVGLQAALQWARGYVDIPNQGQGYPVTVELLSESTGRVLRRVVRSASTELQLGDQQVATMGGSGRRP